MLIDRNNMHNVQKKFQIFDKTKIQLELRQQIQCCRKQDVWVWRDDAYWNEKGNYLAEFQITSGCLPLNFYCKDHDPHVIG